MPVTNRQWIYEERPKGAITASTYARREVTLDPALARNEVLIAARYISVDPYMRIQQFKLDTWEAPHPLGAVQGSAVVGQVVQSNADELAVGDWTLGSSGWQTHALVHQSEVERLNPELAPVTSALGVLGMPGRTAWFGLCEAGRPHPGENVIVSGAAGAVGSLVVQFARLHGCNVIGLAGSDEKCRWLTEELGAARALNYHEFSGAEELAATFRELGGVDVYFDNVGGMITDAALVSANLRARVVICGQISQYNDGLDEPNPGPRLLHHLIYKRATIQGILSRDYADRMDEMVRLVAPMLADGRVVARETIVNGFECLPEALGMLFEGRNVGKLIVKV